MFIQLKGGTYAIYVTRFCYIGGISNCKIVQGGGFDGQKPYSIMIGWLLHYVKEVHTTINNEKRLESKASIWTLRSKKKEDWEVKFYQAQCGKTRNLLSLQ